MKEDPACFEMLYLGLLHCPGFIASEMNLVTLVVLEPGSQPLLYRVHTEDEIIIFIIKAFTREHISFVQNYFL